MSIDHNKVSQEIETPYDDDIVRLNTELNKTYVAYGDQASHYLNNQISQDYNARTLNKNVLVQRSVSKSNKHYKTGTAKWDLVNKLEVEEMDLEDIDEEILPEEMKEMTVQERKDYVATKTVERKKIETKIAGLNSKRQKFIQDNQKNDDEELLDNALINAIHQQAKTKNIVIQK